MLTIHSRILRGLGVLSALALGLALTAPTMAASRHGHAPKPPMIRLPIGGLKSSGEIVDVLSTTQFVLAMPGGDDLAVNLTASTRVVNDTSAGSSSSAGAPVATGEYAVVTYHFDAKTGAVASRVVLSTSPLPTGPVHHVAGMITAVGNGAFTLENASGVSFNVDILPATTMRWIAAGAAGTSAATTTPPLAVGDFASVAIRSAGAVNDATSVTYSNAPIGVKGHGTIKATVTGVSGNVLSLQLDNGGSLSVTVLPGAIVLLNGQAATLSQISANDAVRLQGVRFVGVYYATSVIATSAASGGNG